MKATLLPKHLGTTLFLLLIRTKVLADAHMFLADTSQSIV